MKVLLVSPPSDSPIKSILGAGGLPLGLAYLASVLKDHDVKILDAFILDYDLEKVKREIKKNDPDVVGITATTPTIYDAYRVAEVTKGLNPNCKTIIGGPHVTFTAEETLEECPSLDIVVRREGEETMKEVMTSIGKNSPLKKVKGITFRDDSEIKETEDREFIKNIDEIPFPSFDLLPMEQYDVDGERYGMVMTSRGCPFNCTFCSSSKLCGRMWRGRSPENVIEELILLREEYGVREIGFMDDTFTLDNKRAEKICDSIIDEGLDILWTCSSRVNTINKKLAEKLKKAGCHTIYLGVESGSQRILDIINKGIKLGEAKKAVKTIKEVGLNALASFIIGIPGETIRTIKKTMNFAKKINPSLAQFTICTPYPGTELFEYVKEKGLLLTEDWSKYTTLDPVMKIPGITAEKIKNLMCEAYFRFYLRPKFILKHLKNKDFFLIKWSFKGVINWLRGSRW